MARKTFVELIEQYSNLGPTDIYHPLGIDRQSYFYWRNNNHFPIGYLPALKEITELTYTDIWKAIISSGV